VTKPISLSSSQKVAELMSSLRGSPLAIMLDIDGTLCDIVSTPTGARVPDATRAVLSRLVRLPDVHVSLVTGRSVADACRVAEVAGVYVCGNHGIETRDPSGVIEIDSAAREAIDAFRGIADEVAATLWRYPGVLFEDKHYTLGIHYRHAAPEVVDALRTDMRQLDAREEIRVTEGHCIFDVRPATGADKGIAVRQLTHRFGADAPGASVLFAGDDVTDEDAFHALREYVPHAVTIAVGGRVRETRAEYSLATPDDVRRLLEALAQVRAGKS